MGLRDLSLRTKLVLALLAVGVVAVAVTGGESYRRARRALETDAVNQLTAIREERRRALEAHFARLRLETTTLAETSLVGVAMRRFAAAWDDLERQAERVPPALIAAWRARVAAHQRAYLAPFLPDLVADAVLFEASIVPADPAALMLQLLYTVADPARPGSGDDADRRLAAPHAGPYEEAHGTLDQPLQRLVSRLGYSDLYLIDHRTGRIVFGVEREGDLGVSLSTWPHRETNLARAFRAAREAPDSSAVTLVDFERYVPSRGEPNAFNEILGDGILVIFGAPTSAADDAERAVACAVEMQIAMERFSDERRQQGLPTAEMGIGLHTGQVVVGNIGSARRTKYAAVGTAVNLAGRVESYTTGGQILISEDTYRAVRAPLVVNGRLSVEPKGARAPITVYDIGGIGPPHDLILGSADDAPVTLETPLPIRYAVLEEKHVGRTLFPGRIVRLSRRGAEIAGEERVDPLCTLKIWMLDRSGEPRPGEIYTKAMDGAVIPGAFRVRFTSIAPELASDLGAPGGSPGSA